MGSVGNCGGAGAIRSCCDTMRGGVDAGAELACA